MILALTETKKDKLYTDLRMDTIITVSFQTMNELRDVWFVSFRKVKKLIITRWKFINEGLMTPDMAEE